jgi:hypothetical protein
MDGLTSGGGLAGADAENRRVVSERGNRVAVVAAALLLFTLAGVYLVGAQLGWGVDSQLVGAHFNSIKSVNAAMPPSTPVAVANITIVESRAAKEARRERLHPPKKAMGDNNSAR